MKTYIIFAVTFLVPLFLLALLNCFDIPHIIAAVMFLVPLFLMGKMLRWVVRTLAK